MKCLSTAVFLGVTSQIWILFYLKNNRVMLKSYGSKKLQNNIVFRLDINNIQWSTIPWMIAWNISERYITAKSYVCKGLYTRRWKDGKSRRNFVKWTWQEHIRTARKAYREFSIYWSTARSDDFTYALSRSSTKFN